MSLLTGSISRWAKRAATQRKRQMVDEMLKTPRSSRIGRQHIAKPLGEYQSAAEHSLASESSSSDEEPDPLP